MNVSRWLGTIHEKKEDHTPFAFRDDESLGDNVSCRISEAFASSLCNRPAKASATEATATGSKAISRRDRWPVGQGFVQSNKIILCLEAKECVEVRSNCVLAIGQERPGFASRSVHCPHDDHAPDEILAPNFRCL